MTLQEKIEVMQAAQRGEQIQYYSRAFSLWVDLDGKTHPFNFAACHYRVKPTPREFWINVFIPVALGYVGCAHGSEKSAFDDKGDNLAVKTVRVREVLE